MGRSHDYYCHFCQIYWSPFQFDVCPGCDNDKNSEYDLNHELADDIGLPETRGGLGPLNK